MNVYVDVPLSIALVCLESVIAIVFDKVALDAVVFSTAYEPDRTKTLLTVKNADAAHDVVLPDSNPQFVVHISMTPES